MDIESTRDLRRAFDRLLETKFPRDSVVSDMLSELHARLVEYDGGVAGTASSVLGGVRVEATQLVPDDELGEELKEATRSLEGKARADAEAYLARYRLLDDVLEAARRCAR